MSEVDPAISVAGLWQGYRIKTSGGFRRRGTFAWALRDVSFDVSLGETLAVLGPNGSGKTTLLQVLAHVLRHTRGSVHTRGRAVALVDLFAGFNRELTGHENLLLAGVLTGFSKAALRRRYDDIVAFSGLSDEKLHQPMRTYSSGMALRLGFSLATASNPDVLLVDEVLAVGDSSFKTACARRIGELAEHGAAVVMASHDLRTVTDLSDRAIILDGGVVQFAGRPKEATARYAAKFGNHNAIKDPEVKPEPPVHPEVRKWNPPGLGMDETG